MINLESRMKEQPWISDVTPLFIRMLVWFTTTWMAILSVAFLPVIYAQDQPSFSVDVDVVPIIVTVRNKEGQLVTDLRKEDFILEEEGKQGQSGRKALILLSDGVEFRSMLDSEAAIEAAQRSNTIIYGIRYYDDHTYSRAGRGGMRRGGGPGGIPGGGPGGNPGGWGGDGPRDGEEVLRQLTEETGGALFEVTKKLSLSQIFDQIEAELRSQYILGYRPVGDSHTTHLVLQVRNSDLRTGQLGQHNLCLHSAR
jgi:hypothetical protein